MQQPNYIKRTACYEPPGLWEYRFLFAPSVVLMASRPRPWSVASASQEGSFARFRIKKLHGSSGGKRTPGNLAVHFTTKNKPILLQTMLAASARGDTQTWDLRAADSFGDGLRFLFRFFKRDSTPSRGSSLLKVLLGPAGWRC